MKITFIIISVLILAIAFSFTGCSDPTVYTVGEIGPSGVGIVFYITDGGLSGLEAAPADQSTSQWIAGGSTQSTENGNTLTAIGTGSANTDAIIAQTEHTASAAQVCRAYAGGGLTDWFLPSKDELAELYTQKGVVGGFTDLASYWSSSEDTADNAWEQYFNDGTQLGDPITSSFRARAVRAF